jgi:ABC-type branched-subunit amino acid transport system substrate-binding protein
MSRRAASWRVPPSKGVRMPAEDVNKAGGIIVGDFPSSIECVSVDDNQDIAEAVCFTHELIERHMANVIMT